MIAVLCFALGLWSLALVVRRLWERDAVLWREDWPVIAGELVVAGALLWVWKQQR